MYKYMIGMNFFQKYSKWIFCLAILATGSFVNADEINMSEVRALAKLPVKDILRNSPVRGLDQADYWSTVRQSPKPVVVMFYSNEDKDSQDLATLLRYIAADYNNKILFCDFMVAAKGKPNQSAMTQMKQLYSLDKVPGVLFYDNDKGKMTLEQENYKVPTLKEYRTPGTLLWKVYYREVKKVIDENILD